MKKHEIARENVMTTVGRVTVAVYATDSTDKQTLSTVLYDGKSQLVSGISTQMTYRPGSGLALEDAVKNIIARTSTKYEASQRPLCEHIDYAQAYAELKSANVLHQLCPVEWRAESTRRAALTYYERRSIPLIQHILDCTGDPAVLEGVRQSYLELARKNTDRGDANALATANKHITEANLLYEASRYVLAQYDLPPIEIPLFRTEGIVPPEQAKALPRDDLVRLAELIRLDAAETPLAASAALMMASMLRPAEACPKYGEIIDCGDYGVYAALHNVAGGERIASMKTRNAYRQIVLPKYVMDIVRECREALQKQGYGDSEINDAYVAHHPQDIHRPADPRDISRYVKNKLELLGYNSTYWCGMEIVAQTEPDADERGNALTDVTAYLLRRSGCTYLCNCTSVPLPDGRSVMPHGLVDALMGHRLRGEDAWWAEWIRREDNWPIIAQVLEGIILDPNHSAHPAYAPALPTVSSQVCHVVQTYVVPPNTPPARTVTVTVRCHDRDRVDIRLPKHVQISRENGKFRTTLSRQQSTMPDIQKKITEEYYNTLKEDAQKIYRKAKEIR
mgnify:FL=1